MTAAKTLLALLDFADGDQLLVLLEAENLLLVLGHHGRDRDRLRKELSAGTSPGELLLALFREGHSASDLIALLPADALAKVKASSTRSEASRDKAAATVSSASRPRSAEPSTARGRTTPRRDYTSALPIAFIVYLVALVVPAMLVTGVMPDWTLSLPTGIACAAVGAGAAGLFASNAWPLRIAGLVAGLLSAPGAVALTFVWFALRGSGLRIELALTVIIGALPGALFFYLMSVLYRRRSEAR